MIEGSSAIVDHDEPTVGGESPDCTRSVLVGFFLAVLAGHIKKQSRVDLFAEFQIRIAQ
jgi:hypothetical protein